jgi:hypothetical protein
MGGVGSQKFRGPTSGLVWRVVRALRSSEFGVARLFLGARRETGAFLTHRFYHCRMGDGNPLRRCKAQAKPFTWANRAPLWRPYHSSSAILAVGHHARR